MTKVVVARPAVARKPRPQTDSTAATLKDAKALIKSATLTGANDRNLLTAVRMLRNEIQWNPESKDLWKAGVAAFDKHDKLTGGRNPSTWTPPPEYHAQMAHADQLSKAGDKVGAVRIYRSLVVDYTEHAPIWRAALKLFDPPAKASAGWAP